MNKIFVIGFPKCGTKSFQQSFTNCGLQSIHVIDKRGIQDFTSLAAYRIKTAKENGLPLLKDLSDYTAYSLLSNCNNYYRYWPQLLDVPTLDIQYPNSHFIFNDRNMDNWIRSINNWVDFGQIFRKRLIKFDIPGLPKGKGKEDQELKDWYLWHKNNMIDYFRHKNNFIIYNIENDHSDKLKEFLNLDNFVMTHTNKTIYQ
jgi:hypothetical protein